jgi:hypothetical protein
MEGPIMSESKDSNPLEGVEEKIKRMKALSVERKTRALEDLNNARALQNLPPLTELPREDTPTPKELKQEEKQFSFSRHESPKSLEKGPYRDGKSAGANDKVDD